MLETESCVLIAANPKSGASESGHKVKALQRRIEAASYRAEVIYDLETVAIRSEQLFATGELSAVITAGGDGTADALANLLSPTIPLQLFPLGTENLLAKHFNIQADLEQSVQLLKSGRRIRMDVGSANGSIFLVMASIGFDARVVQEMDAVRTGHINRWSYAKPILRALRGYKFPMLSVRIRSQAVEWSELPRVAWCFVFNVPRYAAGLEFCPQADPIDGALDVCTFRKPGLIHGFGYFSRLFFNTHQSMAGFQHSRAQEIMIRSDQESNGGEVPFQIDGDPGGVLPLHIKTIPQRLTLIVP